MPRIKKGSIIKRDGKYFLYYHYGVYIGNNSVVHYYKSKFGTEIRETSLDDFLDGGECIVVDEPYNRKHANDIVERALSQEFRSNYDMLGSDGENCEHFSNWCHYPDHPVSNQASVLMSQYSYVCSACSNKNGIVECPNCIKGKISCSCLNGYEDCTDCTGTGLVPCDNDCDDGQVECDSSDCCEGKTTCDDCGGHGESGCERCDSSGVIEDTGDECWECEGSGDVRCYNCSGTGEIDCSKCGGENSIECPDCNGSSEIGCSKCDESGTEKHDDCDGTGEIDCDICEGSSTVDCDHCKGRGIEPDPLKKRKK